MKSFLFLFALILFLGCLQQPVAQEPPTQNVSDNATENVTEQNETEVPPANETEETEPEAEEDVQTEEEEPEEMDEPEETEDEEQELPEQPEEQEEPEQTDLKSEDVSFYSYGWEIHATVYENINKNPSKAVFLLPMLGETRESYPQSFITRLHDEFPELMIMAIDSRGHGESTNLGTWEDFDMAQFKDMQNDVISGMAYVESTYPTVKEYYVIGASIGSTSAILAGARDRDIVKIAMISPGMEYKEVNIEDAAEDYQRPLLLVAAIDDYYSLTSTTDINSLSSSQVTKKLYSGSAHGTDLFEATKDEDEPLEDVIVDFLK